MNAPLRRLAMLTGSALLLRVVTQAAALALAARFLGPASYGRITAAVAFASVLAIIPNLGASISVIARSARDSKKASDIWCYAWPQHLVLGPVIAGVYVVAAPWVTSTTLPTSILATLALSEIVLMPLALQLSATLQAIDRVPRSQMLQWIILALRVTSIAICFSLKPISPEMGYAAAQLCATAAGLIACLLITSRDVDLFQRARLPTVTELKSGFLFCATSGVGAASMEVDKVIAIRTVDAHDAGLYSTMSRVVSAGTLPVIGLMMSVQPRLFEHADGSSADMRPLAVRIALTSTALGIGMAVALNIFSPLLPVFFGQRFKEIEHIVPWMSLAIPAMSLRLAGTNIMLTLGQPSRRIAIDAGGILLLGIALSAGGRILGVAGMAVGLAFSEVCLAFAAWAMVLMNLPKRQRSV